MNASSISSETGDSLIAPNNARSGFWTNEDWWAVWLGLGTVGVAVALFLSGSSISWIAVAPGKWSSLGQLGTQIATDDWRYVAQFAVFLAIFALAVPSLGLRARAFIPAFSAIYILSLVIIAAGNWTQSQRYNLEPPLVALAIGLLLSNVIGLPRWLDAGFRVEFYIKLGIVLLGAGLPFTLIVWAGPIAILQA